MQSPQDDKERERVRRSNRRQLVAILAITGIVCALILLELAQRLVDR